MQHYILFGVMVAPCFLYFVTGYKCHDLNPRSCKKRAEAGFCDESSTKLAMSRICKKTCNFCHLTQAQKKALPICQDLNPARCKRRAAMGFCTDPGLKGAMERICRKTCNIC